jgi:hypothetical protein
MSSFHPVWGLFGSNMGGSALAVVRVILFCEFVGTLLFSGVVGTDVMLLSASAFFVTIMMTIVHVGLEFAG